MNKYILIYSVILLCITFKVNAQNANDTIQVNSSVSETERRAWQLIDSIKHAEEVELEERLFELITNNSLTIGYFNFPIWKLIDYNCYEGLQLGFGLNTTKQLSRVLSIGGYFGYGFKDEDWKYGGKINLNIHEKSESQLSFNYNYDVAEKSGYKFLKNQHITSSEVYRKFMIDKMDLVEKFQLELSSSVIHYLRLNLFVNHSYVNSTDNYSFGESLINSVNNFEFSEIGLQFRYAYNEKQKQISESKYTLETNYPVLYGNITQGTNWFNGEFQYTKIEAKITKTFKIQHLGESKLTLVGGLADGHIPLTKLYNGHGSYQSFSIEAENSFGTMRMGEFYTDRFFSVFFKHDFGYLYKTAFSSPKLVVVHNYGLGSLSDKKYHFDSTPIKSYDKGFYEGGILLNNILQSSVIGYGFGVFYRYGPYEFNKTADNFSYKLSLSLGF